MLLGLRRLRSLLNKNLYSCVRVLPLMPKCNTRTRSDMHQSNFIREPDVWLVEYLQIKIGRQFVCPTFILISSLAKNLRIRAG